MKNDIEIEIFGKNLKKLRQDKRLSKSKMAKILHIGTKTLTSLENGILPPRVKANILFIIHKELGISPDKMFDLVPLDSSTSSE